MALCTLSKTFNAQRQDVGILFSIQESSVVNPVAINNDAHKNVRVITRRGADFGENSHFVPVVADEVGNLVLDYPVFFLQDTQSGEFTLNAILGFESGENLFLDGDKWDATYLPVQVRRQPFMVGLQTEGNDQSKSRGVLSLDMDSKRVSETEGEALFNEDGTGTPFLENMNGLISRLMAGIESTKAFIKALQEHDLIMATKLDVRFGDGTSKSFDGLHCVKEEKLRELSDETITEFYKKGYLQACFMIMASMGNVQKLIALKNQRAAQ